MTEAVVKPIAAPAGADTKYQFFVNETTGQKWKATVELRPVRQAMLSQADIETAPAEMAVAITVSPIDDEGNALREDDKPIIIDTHVHSFTHVEMSEPEFDPVKRVMKIIAERVFIGEARIAGVKAIADLVDKWNKKAMLPAEAASYSDKAPMGLARAGVVHIIGSADGEAVIMPEDVPTGVQPTTSAASAEPAASEAPPADETGSEGV